MTDYNKIITTVNSITPDYQFIPDLNNTIVIDTSENRIGINTITPDENIHVSGGTIKTQDLIVLGDYSFNRLSSDIIPRNDLSYNIGSITNRINEIFIGSGSIYMDKTRIIRMADYTRHIEGTNHKSDISALIIDNSGKHLDISDIRHVNVQGDVSFNKNFDLSRHLLVHGDVSFMSKFVVIDDSSFNADVDISGVLNLTYTRPNMSITGTKIYTIFEPNDLGENTTRLIIDPAKYNDQINTSDQGEVVIKGNLKVIGNHTTITSTIVEISDNIILMNANWNDIPYGGIGVNINRDYTSNYQITKQFLYNQHKSATTDDSLDKYRKNTSTSYIRQRAANEEYWDTRGVSINFGNPLSNSETGTGGIIDSDFIYVDNIKLDENKISTTNGNLEIDAIGSNKIDIKNNTHITGNKTLTVTGATYLDNILDVDGVTTLRSTLNVNGGTYLNNILDVDGVTTLRSTLNVNGVSNLNNTLNVNGGAYLNNILDVDGVTTLRNTLNVNGGTYLNNILDVDGVTTLRNTLNVNGQTYLNDILDVDGATTLNNTLDVDGATTLNDTLGVTGATTLNNTLAVTGTTTLNNTLDVTGATTLLDTLDVTKATTLLDTLDVTKATTLLDTLDVTKATTLLDTLDVTKATTLLDTLDVTGATTCTTIGCTEITSTVLTTKNSSSADINVAVKLEALESERDRLEALIVALTATVTANAAAATAATASAVAVSLAADGVQAGQLNVQIARIDVHNSINSIDTSVAANLASITTNTGDITTNSGDITTNYNTINLNSQYATAVNDARAALNVIVTANTGDIAALAGQLDAHRTAAATALTTGLATKQASGSYQAAGNYVKYETYFHLVGLVGSNGENERYVGDSGSSDVVWRYYNDRKSLRIVGR